MSWLYQQFNGIIESCIQKSVGNKTKFAICPYGENAWMVEHLLYQSYGISDVLLIDNRLCKYNENIKGIAELTDTDIENRFFILSSNNGEIRNQLQSIVKEDFICMPEFFVQNAESYSYGPLFTCNNVEGIGRFSCIAEGACVVPNHPMNCVTTHEFMYSSFHFSALNMGNNDLIKWNEINPKKTHIGNDVWIGRNVIITNGASIGNGAIIGAGAVVTKDIPDYAVAVGNPARVIRYRFTPEQIEQLNKIKWWDWPVEKIKAAYQDFKNIDVFIEKYATEHEDKTCQK